MLIFLTLIRSSDVNVFFYSLLSSCIQLQFCLSLIFRCWGCHDFPFCSLSFCYSFHLPDDSFFIFVQIGEHAKAVSSSFRPADCFV
uniref:Uncharacterized protein n=1 Tax=Rhizophora mucronata TaxID=61149 RepID=A0A2P2KR23_RHIMU